MKFNNLLEQVVLGHCFDKVKTFKTISRRKIQTWDNVKLKDGRQGIVGETSRGSIQVNLDVSSRKVVMHKIPVTEVAAVYDSHNNSKTYGKWLAVKHPYATNWLSR